MSEDRVYVPASGPIGAKLMILGEAPSYVEVEQGKPFVGPSGKELDRILADAGMHRSSCWMSNVCKYMVQPNQGKKKIPFIIRAKASGIDIDEQLRDLQHEINEVKPNCILALGGTALWALTGKKSITNYRGSIMMGMGRKTVPTYHPAHLLHSESGEFKGYWNRQVMVFDFKRAKKQSEFPELILPQRTLEICRNSHQLVQFLDRYKSYIKLSVDIEANGTCIPVCVGLAFTPGHGITVPLWNTDGISNIPDSDLVQMWLLLADTLYEKEIIGQNFNYDKDKIRRLGFIIRKRAEDTMMKAFAINPELPKGLAFNTSIYTEEPFYKDEGMYEGSINDLLLGCARDACVTFEVSEKMDTDLDEIGQRKFYENFLMKLPDLYAEMENQGFRIDSVQRENLLRKYIRRDEEIRHELFTLTGDYLNVNSPKQVATLLFEVFKLPARQGTGEDELTALLNNKTNGAKKPEHRRTIELILEGRRVRKTVNTYLMALPDYDGRMKTTFYLCLETGRTGTGQQEPPIRPTIEVVGEDGKKKNKCLGTAFQTITKHGDIGNDVRSMYIPDESDDPNDPYVFVQADSEQAEARVIFRLANDEQALYDIDHHDYHALTASWFFGGTEESYSKRILGYEHPIRFVGKTLRHAGHLGAGKRRAATTVNTDARKFKVDITITEEIADRALTIFHAKQPKIRGVFQNGVIECLKKGRILIAPLPYGIDAEFGGRRTFYERWGEELFRQAFSYLPQRAVTDNTKAAALRIKYRIPKIRIVLEAHDGLVFCMRKSKLQKWVPIIQHEMQRPIQFGNCSLPRPDLIIPCAIEIGHNYEDFHKFKDYIPHGIPIIPKMIPKTVEEEFMPPNPPEEYNYTRDAIYQQQMARHLKRGGSFYEE